ncbi:MAG: TerB family tellurite resistance protein [Myxococcota bacterium]
MKDHIEAIADLLMGAAYADRYLDGREFDSVRQTLLKATGRGVLPADLEARLRRFDPQSHDPAAVAASMTSTLDPTEKRRVLELIAAVHDADEVWDLDEDAYLRRVAGALGLEPSDYGDLSVGEVSVEAWGEGLLPPPLPPEEGDDDP